MREHISTLFQESMLHEYCSVCVFVYAVRQGCVLCKSLAGASSQPGGQTRKQMDWFGLNPSHAILSSWPSLPPSSSNLHTTLCKMKAGQQQSVVLLRGGGEPCLMLLVPRRDGQKTESNLTLPCVSWAVLTHGPCLHVWTLGLLFSSAVSLQYYFFFFLPPMMHSAVGPLSLALLACLLGKCLAFLWDESAERFVH